jgi:CRISPR/Cas system-associated endonuclease Cas1
LNNKNYQKESTDERLRQLERALREVAHAVERTKINAAEYVAAINSFAATGMSLPEATGQALKEVNNRLIEAGRTLREKTAQQTLPYVDLNEYRVDIDNYC